MPDSLSKREFARREGCSHTLVQKAVNAGHLPLLADGKLDPALLGTDWRAANRGNGKVKVATLSPDLAKVETLADAALRALEQSGFLHTRADAERVKENYLARLRQLEFEIKSRAVFSPCRRGAGHGPGRADIP